MSDVWYRYRVRRSGRQTKTSRVSMTRRFGDQIPGTRLELVRPKGRGILSPLRLPIPPPGQDSVFTPDSAVKQALLIESRWPAHLTLAALKLACSQLLRPAPKLILESEQFRPLNRRQEFRKLALLILHEIESLTLEHHRLIEELRNAVLIRLVSRDNLLPQLSAQLTLAHHEVAALLFELSICSLQLLHLIVGELQPSPDDFAGALAQTIFEHLSTRVHRCRLLLRILC